MPYQAESTAQSHESRPEGLKLAMMIGKALMWASPVKRMFFRGLTLVNTATLWMQSHLSGTHPTLFEDASHGLGLTAGDVVVVIVPHPDDETLGMGGTLAVLTEAGVHVHLLLLTDGCLSGAGVLRPLPPDKRASIRIDEFRSAIKSLSPKISYSGPVFAEHQTITSGAKAEAVQVALQLLDDLRPQIIFAPPPYDFHPHHVFAANLAATMVKTGMATDDISLFHYEVQSPFADTDPWIGIASPPQQEARCQRAKDAYKTQAQSVKNAARLKWYRRVQTKAHAHVDLFLKADLASDQPIHRRGLSNNPTHDLRLMRGFPLITKKGTGTGS